MMLTAKRSETFAARTEALATVALKWPLLYWAGSATGASL